MDSKFVFRDTLQEIAHSTRQNNLALAGLCSASPAAVSRWMSGEQTPNEDTLVVLCKALSPAHSSQLAKAWIRTRLGTEISDLVLAIDNSSHSELETIYGSLTAATCRAMLVLMRHARDSSDLRLSLEKLASYIDPDNQSITAKPIVHSFNEPSPIAPDTELVEIEFSKDEAEVLELAKRKGTLARKMSKAAARLPKTGKPGATSAS